MNASRSKQIDSQNRDNSKDDTEKDIEDMVRAPEKLMSTNHDPSRKDPGMNMPTNQGYKSLGGPKIQEDDVKKNSSKLINQNSKSTPTKPQEVFTTNKNNNPDDNSLGPQKSVHQKEPGKRSPIKPNQNIAQANDNIHPKSQTDKNNSEEFDLRSESTESKNVPKLPISKNNNEKTDDKKPNEKIVKANRNNPKELGKPVVEMNGKIDIIPHVNTTTNNSVNNERPSTTQNKPLQKKKKNTF